MALTKPRIIELLLVTTVPTMVVAERGLPSVWLIVCTVLGGTFAAGGANAINMYVDRDIDRLMERTKGRPARHGRDDARGPPSPSPSLLEVVAFGFLWATVNLLSAVLAVAACLFYVFVYTLWLKRTSTHNIVIGGAAGAVPDPHRLELGHRHPRLGAGAAVRDHLLLDPAALLGPRHPLPRRLRRRRRADAARWSRACAARPGGSSPTPCCCGRSPSPSRRSPAWATSTSARRSSWAACSPGTPSGSSGCRIRASGVAVSGGAAELEVRAVAMRLFTWSITYITLLFGAMAVDQLLRSGW